MRNTTARIADGIDRITATVGRLAIWSSLYIVIAEFAVVTMRYLFGGSIRLQKSVLYAHAALFMLAAAWVLQIDNHVRVDIFYARGAPRPGVCRPFRRGLLSLSFRNRADAGGAP